MGAKIRTAEINKVPIMLIVGEKEMDDKTVSVRRLGSNNTQTETVENFIEKFQNITKSPIEEK